MTFPILASIGRALLRASEAPGFSWIISPDVIEEVWSVWSRQTETSEQKRLELESLARTTAAESQAAAAATLRDLSVAQSTETARALGVYLCLIPGFIRKHCRRPGNPAGASWPAKLVLEGPRDLASILPARLPHFAPGERPASLGEWEFQDLLELGAFGEAWKASNVRQPDTGFAVFHAFFHPKACVYLQREGGAILERVLALGPLAGIVPLQQAHVQTDPPFVQYAFLDAADLSGLVQDWLETGAKQNPEAVAAVIAQVAASLGKLHRQTPPLVHGNLCPATVLVRQSGPEQWQCHLASLGLGPWGGSGRAGGNLYASPERSRGDAPQPRADVYALGMLWYQLLVRNLEATRPGGSAWRRKLAEQGVTQAMLELLESCFEDNPADRPADAAALAERLHGMTPAAPAVATAVAEPELGVRPRSRRADVRKLFDTLEQAAPERQKLLSNSVGMKLVLIPAGTVAMGSPEAEAGRRINEGPQHEVALTRDFYFAVTLVTQKQFLDVMGHNPAKFSPGQGGDLENPVEYVTWLEATAFCQRLSAMPQEKQAGRKYRLPTEAEWEYACRAGTTTAFSFGAELGHGQANFDSRFPVGSRAGMPLQKPSRVASYPANHFGLYDIHGNVWEWCQDWFDSAYYARSPRRDPPGPEQGEFRVLRGGSWRNHAATCRSAYRNGMPPTSRDKYTGFRVVMELSA